MRAELLEATGAIAVRGLFPGRVAGAPVLRVVGRVVVMVRIWDKFGTATCAEAANRLTDAGVWLRSAVAFLSPPDRMNGSLGHFNS